MAVKRDLNNFLGLAMEIRLSYIVRTLHFLQSDLAFLHSGWDHSINR